MDMLPVDGVPADVSWGDYDPKKWREHPEPEGQDDDDDQDIPTPDDVFAVSGIDPDEEGWDDDE